jgi:hypothetical protein
LATTCDELSILVHHSHSLPTTCSATSSRCKITGFPLWVAPCSGEVPPSILAAS